MSLEQSELVIDLGNAVHGENGARCSVRLDATPLQALIEAARSAHRVYELLLIDRPGDIWGYVWVVLEDVPEFITDRLRLSSPSASAWLDELPPPWPEGRVPFKVFDAAFSCDSEDLYPVEEAWLSQMNKLRMRSFVQGALQAVLNAKLSMQSSDPLLRHIVDAVACGTHPYCFTDRRVARDKGREFSPNSPVHSSSFYEKLAALLSDPQVGSVAYRADGDYQVLRMLATEQRRRANLTQKTPDLAFRLSALVNQRVDGDAWDSKINFYGEGIGYGDLFVDGGGLGDGRLRSLMGLPRYAPRRFLLASRDEGQIAGFDQELGDGWVVYRKIIADG